MRYIKIKARLLLTSLLGKPFTSLKLPNSNIISFDVFDTLIIRPGYNLPTDVFDILSPNPDFKEARIEAERKTRTESKSEDITLESIYEKLYENPRERQEAMEREISTELSICKCNIPALAFFNKVKESGKKIIIISDMYLKASDIEKLLRNCGYDLDGVEIYVSSEYGLTKRSGNLFKTVLSDLKAQKAIKSSNDITHIGDNLRSDWLMARKVGLKAVLVKASR